MKLMRVFLIVLVIVANLVFAQPSLADRPKLTQSSDYTEVTQALNSLLRAKNSPNQSDYTPEEIQKQISVLQLEKYIMETAKDWAQCSNETGKTLVVYAHKPKKSSFSDQSTLYYLGNGKSTDEEWNCDGVYLPSSVKISGLTFSDSQAKELGEPLALKIVPGTQLVAKTNSETGAVEFSVAPATFFKAGNWNVPNLAQADIDSQKPNAPIDD
ncbi:MAG: hypothetical protein KME05_14520 [Gloeocapsa sp. UFS-A4-WI-NPMV-4B04]|nr:hypothetical protein [Gloeocapsa sp. UFS-A4-WI-NPMV-4B04]